METSPTLMQRIMGVITLKAPVYKDIASDPKATPQARNVVIIVAILAAIFNGATGVIFGNGLIAGIVLAVIALASVLISWFIGAWALAFVAKTFFKGQTETQNMLRVTGFTTVFQVVTYVLGIIPCVGAIGALIGSILQIIGNIIGIREAGGLDTTKAILTAIIAGVVVFIIASIIAAIGALIGVGGAAMTQPQ
jgi:hypothetical protein